MSNEIERDARRFEDAEEWLRDRYGAARAHPEWRTLVEAFNAGRAVLAAADAAHGGEAHTAADVLRYAKGDEALTSWLGRTLVPAVVDEGSWDHLKLQLEAIAWDQKLNLEDALATVDGFVRDYSRPHCHPAPAAPAAPEGYELVPVAGAVWGMYAEECVALIQRGTEDDRIAKAGGERLYRLSAAPKPEAVAGKEGGA